MDLAPLQHAWPLAGPWQVTPLAHGTNNTVQRVATPGGDYVLRVYRNHGDLGRLRFEHAILTRLAAADLPFALPVPLPTRTGELYVAIAGRDGEALATLTPLIAGEHPARERLDQARAAGAALGLLDAALGGVPADDLDQSVTWRSYGDLAHCHPLVPDPRAAIQTLPVPDTTRRRLTERYDWLMASIPALYASLPQQLVHEDYAPDNTLMDGTRVTGVLDFEFCTRDVRVMDLTVALSWWPVAQFGTGGEWPILAAVAQGYARHIALSAGEIAAVPTLFQLRAYTSLIHRLGRQRQGLSPMEAVVARAEAAIAREAWVAANGERLVALLSEPVE